MMVLWRALVVAFMVVAFLPRLPAQTKLETLLSTQVKSAVVSVSSQPELSAWSGAHGRERIDLAHFQTDKDSYEIDFAHENQWCATSVTEAPKGVARAASFYVPEVARGALPALPVQPTSALTGACRLGAI